MSHTFKDSVISFAKEKSIREARNIIVVENNEGLSYDIMPATYATEDEIENALEHIVHQDIDRLVEEEIHSYKYLSEGDTVRLNNETTCTVEQGTSSQIVLSTGDKMRRSDGCKWGSDTNTDQNILCINTLIRHK